MYYTLYIAEKARNDSTSISQTKYTFTKQSVLLPLLAQELDLLPF